MISGKAFYGCSSLTSIEIPNSVTSIGDHAFFGCIGLTSVTIPNSVTSIGWYVFSGCSGLTSIEIPNSVTNIGGVAFYGCTALTSITIPNSVTTIGIRAFSGCSGLNALTIPSSISDIGQSAFSGCSGLSSIKVDERNPKYDSRNNCNAIIEKVSNSLITGCKNTTIPNNVTSIGDGAFEDCSSLTSIEIPNSVTSIGSSAFDGCTGLTSVTIPNSVTSIASETFYNTNLRSVTIGTGVLSISYNAFSGAKPVKVIWLTNTPPSGYENVGGKVNYVANDLYERLSNKTVYPFLSSMFEAGGVKYVPVSPSERTCDAIDCTYDASAANVNIGKTVSYKGVSMTVNNINPYTCYKNPSIISVEISFDGNIGSQAFYGCGSLNNVTLSNNGDIGISAFESSNITSTLCCEKHRKHRRRCF